MASRCGRSVLIWPHRDPGPGLVGGDRWPAVLAAITHAAMNALVAAAAIRGP